MNRNEQTHYPASPDAVPSNAARINRTLSLSIVEGCAWAVMWASANHSWGHSPAHRGQRDRTPRPTQSPVFTHNDYVAFKEH
ncbi:MAG: hypothetical protein WCI03_00375 [bacterium]